MDQTDYREAFEAERDKLADMADSLAALSRENARLERDLLRIRGNPLWKASAPARAALRALLRLRRRLRPRARLRDLLRGASAPAPDYMVWSRFGKTAFPDSAQAAAEADTRFPRMPKISLLVPLWNNDPVFQTEMLESVLAQTYTNWELCLADGSDADHAYIGEICRKHAAESGGRILYKRLERNAGISGNTNACLAMASGDFVGLLDQDDLLHPSALFECVKALNETGADYLYTDEATFKNGDIDQIVTPHFKPDFAPDNLRANNYICHLSVFARKLLDGGELFRPAFDGSQDHDMILRLTDRAEKVVHIPRILYYWRHHEGSVSAGIGAKPYAVEAAKRAVAEHLRSRGFDGFRISGTRAFDTIFRVRYRVSGLPKISIVVANKDHADDLRRCVSSIRDRSTYRNFEIVVVENNSTSPEIREYYRELCGNGNASPDGSVRVVTYSGAFNYSAVNNLGVRHATGDYILLLNNDTEVLTPTWMEELLMYAQREDVGAVGAKLYYPDGTVQHAGVVIGLGAHRTAGHVHYRLPGESLGYMGRLCYAQDVSAVTGACLMMKKRLFEEAGGLDERLAVSLSDIDLCLKLRERGLLNVFTPFAELVHHESVSRGSDAEGGNAARYERESAFFREKWADALKAGDPYYNRALSLDRDAFSDLC